MWELSHWGGLNEHVRVDSIDVDFRKNPLKLTIADDATQKPIASWSWNFSATVNWDSFIFSSNYYGPEKIGRVELGAEIDHKSTERSFATLEDDELKLEVSFEESDQPKMKEPAWKERQTNLFQKLIKEVPPSFKDVKIHLKPFTACFPSLNFFATQNIFASGKRFINVSDVMIPYDVVLMGKMARAS